MKKINIFVLAIAIALSAAGAFAAHGLYYCQSSQYSGVYNPDSVIPPKGSALERQLGPASPKELAFRDLYKQGRCKKMTMQICPTKYFDCYVWSLSGKYITGGSCRHNSLGLKMKNAGNDPSMQYFPEESELKSVYNSRKCRVLSGSY